ncbi:MlaD family protein [Polymorphobacter fuscus]|uniref:MCE family protein n=1 Tax=Sandarakinorhabdus fusca TaxID=1439888 RepID=A0A7C9KLY1_9SPHN|nr:MlaD family protein [Polymorphobacter fuscus]KAB7649003.1 MCE family protein [Polymorphobacter fuscus]MQT16604.1 MCE family protein [Polymorphobacter fuscus]NJC07106.1 phospholipid/cholesterol/gamma-HCH transport system substrate-binding protein [Polymorphobacter fuscus]
METRSNYAIVGAVVVALVVAMFIAVLWLARFAGADDQRFDIFFKQSISGLAIGSPVAFNGVPVGKIDEIKLLPDTPQYVRVRISIAEDVPVLKGTTAAVEGVGFTGVSQIALSGAMQGAERITAPGPYGVPVIPPRVGGFGALLASAPELLNNVSKLTERLGELLNPANRNSLGNILKNADRVSGALADRAPEIADTIVEARATLRAATATLARFEGLAGSAQDMIDKDGRPLIADLRRTVQSANASLARVDALTAAAQPGVETLTTETLPEANRLIRDLRDVTTSLGAVAAKLDEDPAGALIGGRNLPDYSPPKQAEDTK